MRRKKELNKVVPYQMAVRGLFLDFDGTINPLKTARTETEVPETIHLALEQIGRLIPIVIITMKDLPFVKARTPFAHAWSAVSGLEKRIGDKILQTDGLENKLQLISHALAYAKSHVSVADVEIEEKRDSYGRAIAFCVDWRKAKEAERAKHEAERVASYCEALDLQLIRYTGQPFYDVSPVSVDKGKALKDMLQELKLKNGILYIGDSEMDNPAFKMSDVSLGVIHEATPVQNLECDHFVRFDEIADFLNALLTNQLVFSSDFPMIETNPRKMRRH